MSDKSGIPKKEGRSDFIKQKADSIKPIINPTIEPAVEKIKEVHLKPSDAKKYFDVPESQLKKLRFSDVSLYSTTPTDQAIYTANLLLTYYTKDELKQKVLTDATACIGGNTWVFADYVKRVQAIEISKLHADMLYSNMQTLKKENVSVTNDNCLNTYLCLDQDIIFFDPPWGGINYKDKDATNIHLADITDVLIPLDQIVNGLLAYRCETMVLKLPVNYDIKKITLHTSFINIDDLVIYSDSDAGNLYRLVVLSHLPRITATPKPRGFHRIGYKAIITV